jgi:hypothetical protein
MTLKPLYTQPRVYVECNDTEKDFCKWRSLGSLINSVTCSDSLAAQPGFDCRHGHVFFHFAMASRPAAVSVDSRITMGSGTVKPITHLHLVSKLRMRGVIPPLFNASYDNTTRNSCIFLLYEDTRVVMPIKNNECTKHECWRLAISNTFWNVAAIAHLSVTLILPLL